MTSCFTVAFVRDLLLSEHLLKPPHLPSHNLKGSLHSPHCFFGNWEGQFTKSPKIFFPGDL